MIAHKLNIIRDKYSNWQQILLYSTYIRLLVWNTIGRYQLHGYAKYKTHKIILLFSKVHP